MPWSCTGRWCVAIVAAGLLCAEDAQAWESAVPDAFDVPLVAVDKSRQRLMAVGSGRVETYVCTSGQKHGDKQVRDDLKTPEGIYFITEKSASGLDFQEYGGVAYPLDYPNPVDRLRGKTGYGIWLHSRGRPITPYESRGCVAVDLDDMAALSGFLETGMPVIVAERLRHGNDASAGEAASRVERRTRGWHEAWREAGKAEGYYLPSAQGKDLAAQMRRERKKLLKGRTPVKAETGPVRVLEGPGYWVSWFSERVLLDKGALAGTRRLYWQEDEGGALRIVGARWIAGDGNAAP